MKKKLKSYLVFTGFWYRILMFAIMPIALLALQILSGFPAIVMFLIMIEIVADNWFLGGIQEKGAEKIDCLKTSCKGMEIMRSALVFDLIRRLLAATGIFGFSYLAGRFLGAEGNHWETCLLSIVISFTLSVAGTLISRFESYLWVNMVTAYLAAVIGLIFILLSENEAFAPWKGILGIAFVILGICVSILAVKVAMKKVKGGYYDK